MSNLIDNKIIEISHGNESVNLVYQAIKDLKSQFKISDLVVKTGLSIYNVEDALEQLIKEIPCRFHVDDEGNILYDFSLQQERKEKKQSWFRRGVRFLKKTINYLFKGWIVFMFLGYFVFYFPAITYYFLPTALMYLGAGIMILVFAILMPLTIVIGYFYMLAQPAIDDRGMIDIPEKKKKYKKLKPVKLTGFFSGDRLFFTDKVKFKWNFIKTVFSYVFGDQSHYKVDELDLEKKILFYINSNNKKITVAELIAITGWDIIKAETEMTKIFVQYHGKVDVTEEGAIIYTFPEIESQKIDGIEKEPFVWKNKLKLNPWNRNFTFENSLITFFGFAILCASGFLTFFNLDIPLDNFPEIFSLLNYHWFPLVFMFIFFAASMSNKYTYQKINNERIDELSGYWSVLKEIFQSPNKTEFKENQHFEKAITDLKGNISTDSEGNISCDFPYLERDLLAIAKENKEEDAYGKFSREQVNSITKIEFDEDFMDGERTLMAERILRVENDKEMAFYMKLSGNNTGVKLYSLVTFFLLFLMFIHQSADGGTGFMIFLIGFIPAILACVGIYYQLSNLFNTTIIKLQEDNMIIKHLPFDLFDDEKVIPLENIEGFSIKAHGRNFYKLSIGISTKKFPITIMDYIRDRSLLEEIVSHIYGYIEDQYE